MTQRRWLAPVVLGASALVLGGSVLGVSLRRRPPPAPPEELPPAPAPQCTALYYAASLKEAAARLRVPEVSPEVMSQPLRGGAELSVPRELRPGAIVTTAHLRVAASVVRLRSTSDGTQGITTDHLVLSITNRSTRPVAYRVVTSVPDPSRCSAKATLAHNAIVLGPQETARRTECLYRDREPLTVRQIDALEVTELGSRYLSRLEPAFNGTFDERVARGHERGGLEPCEQASMSTAVPGLDPWRAVIDYYARHDCDEYRMPASYRPFAAAGSLPQCPP